MRCTQGSMLERDGVRAGVLNMSTVRPIDEEAIRAAALRGPIVTLEEHTTMGGLGGSWLASALTGFDGDENFSISLSEEHIPHGSSEFQQGWM